MSQNDSPKKKNCTNNETLDFRVNVDESNNDNRNQWETFLRELGIGRNSSRDEDSFKDINHLINELRTEAEKYRTEQEKYKAEQERYKALQERHKSDIEKIRLEEAKIRLSRMKKD